MTYIRVGEDWSGSRPLGELEQFGVAPAPSSRTRIVLRAFDNRGAEVVPRIAIPATAVARVHAQRIRALRIVPRVMSLRGLGATDTGATIDDLLSAINELTDLQRTVQPGVVNAVGAGSIVSRAGSLAGDLGLPINHNDVIATAQREAQRFTGLTEGSYPDIVAHYAGNRATTMLRGAGVPIQDVGTLVSRFQGLYGNLHSGLTATAGAAFNAVRDQVGFAGQGLRRLTEEFQESGAGDWINMETMTQVVGLVQRWASVASGDELQIASNVFSAAGGTLALGANVPGPAGWGFAIAGAACSLVGSLLDLFEGEPPPPLRPCSEAGAPLYADEWACVRLFMASDPGREIPDTASADDLRAGWGVKVDQDTGEAMVKEEGSAVYRRVLDVFPNGRRNLLSLEHDWIAGTSAASLAATGALDCGGHIPRLWRGGCDYEFRPYVTYGMAGTRLINDSVPRLWCVPGGENLVRFINADKTSPAIRFRVPTMPGSDPPEEDKKYRQLPWAEGSEAIGYDRIQRNVDIQYQRKAGILAAAVLGGCAPFGLIQLRDTWAVCTGVGGREHQDGPTRGIWSPAIAMWRGGTENRVLVLPPRQYPLGTTLQQMRNDLRTSASYRDAVPLADVVAELEDEDTRVSKWHAPAASPPKCPTGQARNADGVCVPAGRGFPGASRLIVPSIHEPRHFIVPCPAGQVRGADGRCVAEEYKREPEKMSTGAKVLLVGGGLALVGGGIYALARARKR